MSDSIGQEQELYTGLIRKTFIDNIDSKFVFYKDEGGKHNYIVLYLHNKYKNNITGNIEILLDNLSFEDDDNIISYSITDEIKETQINYKLLEDETKDSNNIRQTPNLTNYKPEMIIAINNRIEFELNTRKSKLVFIRIDKVSRRKDDKNFKIRISYIRNNKRYYEETDEIVVKSKRKIPAKTRFNKEAADNFKKKRKLNPKSKKKTHVSTSYNEHELFLEILNKLEYIENQVQINNKLLQDLHNKLSESNNQTIRGKFSFTVDNTSIEKDDIEYAKSLTPIPVAVLSEEWSFN